jgi:hypothetical protein
MYRCVLIQTGSVYPSVFLAEGFNTFDDMGELLLEGEREK